MLRRLPAVLVLAALLAIPAQSASAAKAGCTGGDDLNGASSVTCTATDPGTTNGLAPSIGGGNGGGPQVCTYQGRTIDCTNEYGWWYADRACWVQPLDDVAAAEIEWLDRGSAPHWCASPDDPGNRTVVGIPAGAGPGAPAVDPAVLARQAIDSMQLRGITIGIAPPADSYGLVNAPVWLWVAEPAPNTWGPMTVTASAGAVTVTATARAAGVAWQMGDGSTVTCGEGVAYSPGIDPADPPCGHTYSTKGQRPITATTSWRVQWTSNTGASGSETLQAVSSTTLDVREALAVVTGSGRG